MLELFLKLIDRSILLIGERKKSDTLILRGFLEPIYADFTAFHESYLSSFKRYRLLLEDGASFPIAIRSLLEKLDVDNLFSGHQRERLRIFSSELEAAQRASKRLDATDVILFLGAIRSYIEASSYICHDDSDELRQHLGDWMNRSQVWRNSLKGALEEKMTSTELYGGQLLSEALFALDGVVLNMQHQYAVVTGYYLTIKSELSSP